MNIQLQPEFDDILQPLGNAAAEFFLAASLYHARKISFASAAQLAGLDFESFKTVKVVLNTSPIIFLGKMDCLKILTECFAEIYVPQGVIDEVQDYPLPVNMQI